MTRVVHRKKEPFDVYVGRPSKWGNPFRIDPQAKARSNIYAVATREEAIERYRVYLLSNAELLQALPELKDKTLACWCAPNPCHGDVLIELLSLHDKVEFHHGDGEWHDGCGWYWVDREYPDEGSHGAFLTYVEAFSHALDTYAGDLHVD